MCNLAPDDHRGHANRAFYLAYLLRFEEALAVSDRVIELAPDGAYYLCNHACYLVKAGKYHQAVTLATHLIEKDSHFLRAYCARATARYYLGIFDQALVDINIGYVYDESTPIIACIRAKILFALHR